MPYGTRENVKNKAKIATNVMLFPALLFIFVKLASAVLQHKISFNNLLFFIIFFIILLTE
jgi:hypothetical protein